MIRREDVEQGTISLNEITFLMEQNRSRAECSGLTLRYEFSNNVYYGIIKKDKTILFKHPYYERMLIKALIYMHIDFCEYLNKRRRM